MYSKIIQSQLNTMQVNKLWKLGSDICPVCHQQPEDWLHVISCTKANIVRVRGKIIKDFRSLMKRQNKYPPLREFIIDCVRYPEFDKPPDLLVVNPRYALLDAFQSQTVLGWKNFYRGYVTTKWEHIQYKYLLELNH